MPWVETQPKGAVDGNWASASCSSDGTIVLVADSGGRLWKSTDSAVNWDEVRPAGDADKNWSVVAVSSTDGSVMLACVYGGRVYKSIDTGANWAEITPAGSAVNRNWTALCCDADGSVIVAGHYSQSGVTAALYLSTNSGTNWTQCTGVPTTCFNGVACDSDGSVILAACGGSGLYRDANGDGAFGNIKDNILPNTYRTFTSVAVNPDGTAMMTTNLQSGGGFTWYGGYPTLDYNPGVAGYPWFSLDGGATWDKDNNNGSWLGCALDSDGSVMLAGSNETDVSVNSGTTWASAGIGNTQVWKAFACNTDGTVRIAGDYGGRLYRFTSSITLAPTSVVGYGAFGLPAIVFAPLQIGATSVVGYGAFGLPSVDLAGSPTVKITYPEGTLDIPAVITSTTPTVQWVFTNTQVKFCLSSFDWTAGSINYTTGWVTSAARYHTLTSALTPGHTYSFQVLVQDDAAAVWSSDERSWCHINDATITAPVLTAEPDTNTKTAITLDWTAAVTTDSDTLTYEVEIITY